MIGVVLMLSRPAFLRASLENFERQRHPNKLICVVENGAGLGACESQDVRPDILATSAHHRSHARNAGFEALRAAGIQHWAIFEDDDWYGPDYLAEVWEHRDRADVLGKQTFLMQGDDDSLWRLHPDGEHRYVDLLRDGRGGLVAATLAGRTDRALPFTAEVERCEEVIWYLDMLRSGRTLYSTSDDHFVQLRYGPPHVHASRIHWSTEVRQARGQCLREARL